jgi:hypothetical protein
VTSDENLPISSESRDHTTLTVLLVRSFTSGQEGLASIRSSLAAGNQPPEPRTSHAKRVFVVWDGQNKETAIGVTAVMPGIRTTNTIQNHTYGYTYSI